MKRILPLPQLIFISLLATLLNQCNLAPEKEQAEITIHLIGDSTMADKPDPDNNPERGWGQLLHIFFNDRVTVINHAKGGRSSKSFIDQGRWHRVLAQLKPGDFVLIQFGHNDQKAYDPARYTNPFTAYRRNLERFVTEAREKGAHPILLSSIVRRNFNEEGTLEDTHGQYPLITRDVARSLDVTFIDLQQSTEDLVSGLGPERSKGLYMVLESGKYDKYPEGKVDNTHLVAWGANEVCGMVARSIEELGIPLSNYLNPQIKDPRVLLVVGGHDFDTTEFFDTFHAMEGIHFDSISHPDALHLLSSEYINSYDVLLFYDFKKDLPKKDSSIFLNLTQKGIPMIFLHHAMCTFQAWDGYLDIVGGRMVDPGYAKDPSEASGYKHDIDIQIEIVQPEHPIAQGIDNFLIRDEGYSNITVAPDIELLLTCNHPDCSEYVGWVNSYANSTIVTLMLGHDKVAYGNESFQKILYNSINWLSSL